MTPPFVLDVPNGWPRPDDFDDGVVARALEITGEALSDGTVRPATDRLAAYYDPARKYSGVTFLELPPVEPDMVTAADLHALTVLNAPVDALTTRRLLADEQAPAAIEEALGRLDPGADLAHADRSTLEAMDALWHLIYRACSDPWARTSNPWVTAAKLCARKRPHLFPIRDSVVCEGLGLYGTPLRPQGDRRIDWQVFAALIADSDVYGRVAELTGHVEARGVRCDGVPLRVLDVALWTWLRAGNRSST